MVRLRLGEGPHHVSAAALLWRKVVLITLYSVCSAQVQSNTGGGSEYVHITAPEAGPRLSALTLTVANRTAISSDPRLLVRFRVFVLIGGAGAFTGFRRWRTQSSTSC